MKKLFFLLLTLGSLNAAPTLTFDSAFNAYVNGVHAGRLVDLYANYPGARAAINTAISTKISAVASVNPERARAALNHVLTTSFTPTAQCQTDVSNAEAAQLGMLKKERDQFDREALIVQMKIAIKQVNEDIQAAQYRLNKMLANQ